MSDERELVAALRRGERAALEAAYDLHKQMVYRFLVRLVGRDRADDLYQETWLRLARHARRLREDTRLRSWLLAVAHNLAKDSMRARTFAPFDDTVATQVADAPTPLQHAADRQRTRRVEQALLGLPLGQREAILLCGIEGLAPTEAAVIVGVSPEAMRQRLSRARAALEAATESLDAPTSPSRIKVTHER